MPPEERFLPRFAAEPPHEELPYGRWQERLSEEFLAAALAIDPEPEDLGKPGEIRWYPDRSWHGRTYIPATAETSGGYELFGYVRFIQTARTTSRATSPPTSTTPRRPPRATPTGSSTSATRSSGSGAAMPAPRPR